MENTLTDRLKYNSVVISTHIWTEEGPAQALLRYLNDQKMQRILWISHPLLYHKRLKGSGYTIYEYGEKKIERYAAISKIPSVLSYFWNILLTVLFVVKSKRKYDLYIGYNNLNALSGHILKKLAKVKKCVYYVVDYTPKRFENRFLNWVYHKLEILCTIYCDETWNLCSRMIAARKVFQGLDVHRCGTQKVVPMGIWYDEIKRYDIHSIQIHQLIFMGHLLEKQGVQFVLQAVPFVAKEIPDFTFLIIGDGEYKAELQKLTKKLKIEKYVEFTGFIEDHEEIEELIGKSAVAVAPYNKGDIYRNWTYYSDPGKVKVYLGSGVPLLVTNVPHNAYELEQEKCGKVIDLNPESISNAIVELMKDDSSLPNYRQNALFFSKKYDWNNIFSPLFQKLLS